MALTESIVRDYKAGLREEQFDLPVAAGVTIFKNAYVMFDGYLKPASQSPTSANPQGNMIALEKVDNSAGGDGAASCKISSGRATLATNSSSNPVTSAHRWQRVRFEDDDTVCVGGGGPEAGIFIGFLNGTNTNYCWIVHDWRGGIPSSASAAPTIAAVQTLAADDDIDLGGNYDIYDFAGDGGDVTLTKNLPNATDGRLIILRGTDDAAKVTFQDNKNTELVGDQSATLGDGDELWLRGHGTVHREVRRSIHT